MKRFIISEEQSQMLAELLKEEAYQMPVPKETGGPYCINPDNVKIVKNFLDKGFKKENYERIGTNGFPENIKVIGMVASTGDVLKHLYMEDMEDLLIDKFQNMFSNHDERSKFMKQVLKDWYDDKISPFGMLSVNHL